MSSKYAYTILWQQEALRRYPNWYDNMDFAPSQESRKTKISINLSRQNYTVLMTS